VSSQRSDGASLPNKSKSQFRGSLGELVLMLKICF
jgi:hypothetical protein